jgi:hypothetical protein
VTFPKVAKNISNKKEGNSILSTKPKSLFSTEHFIFASKS